MHNRGERFFAYINNCDYVIYNNKKFNHYTRLLRLSVLLALNNNNYRMQLSKQRMQ